MPSTGWVATLPSCLSYRMMYSSRGLPQNAASSSCLPALLGVVAPVVLQTLQSSAVELPGGIMPHFALLKHAVSTQPNPLNMPDIGDQARTLACQTDVADGGQLLSSKHSELASAAGTPVGASLATLKGLSSLKDWYETFRVCQVRTRCFPSASAYTSCVISISACRQTTVVQALRALTCCEPCDSCASARGTLGVTSHVLCILQVVLLSHQPSISKAAAGHWHPIMQC